MLPRGLVALFVVALLASNAPAQVISDEVGIERFRPAMDRAGLLDVEWGGVPDHLSWSAGMLVGFAHAPLVIYDRSMTAVDALVEKRLSTVLVGSLALWERLQVGITANIVGYQSGDENMPLVRSLPTGGLGDLRLVTKVLLVGDERIQISFVPALTIPGGGGRGFLREPGVAFAPALAVSGRGGKLRGALNVGYHLKSRVETPGLVTDDEAFARAGAGFAVAKTAEIWWSTSIAAPLADAEANVTAVEMLLGGEVAFGRSLGVFAAGGIGLNNGFGTPDWRALAGVRYEKPSRERVRVVVAPPDADADGIVDAKDRCPRDAEDLDKFQDEDGCSDPDNDADGVPDTGDRCPLAAEDKDGFQDGDGCADAMSRIEGRVVDKDGRPIGGAAVTIVQTELTNGTPLELTASADGTFATELHGGVLEISGRAPEYKDTAMPTTVAPGTTGKVDVVLLRAIRQGQLRGQVLSFNGQPLSATITVTDKAGTPPITATTDADGQFTIELPAGPFTVEVVSPGHIAQKRNVQIKLDGVTVLNVDMRSTK